MGLLSKVENKLAAYSDRMNLPGPTAAEPSGAAIVLSTTYGDMNMENILPTFHSYAKDAFQSNSIVFGAVLARMMLFSEVEFQFQSMVDRHLFGTSDLQILETPWPGATTGELLARMELDASIAGTFYGRDINGERIERLRPDRVTIISAASSDDMGRTYREVVGYAYDRAGDRSDIEIYDVSEVCKYAPIPDPFADFRGMSWMTPIVREINADQGMTDFKIRYLSKGATPNMTIVYDKQIKPGTIEALEDRLESKYGGVGNAGKFLVLDQGAVTNTVGNSLEQMNFSTVQAAGENRILIASGVPGIVVGSKEGLQAATYSNYAQAMRRFVDLTMRPLWRIACASLTPLVNVPQASRLAVDTRHIAALQAGEQERATVQQTKAQTMASLIAAGYDPDSVTAAVNGEDYTLLKHTGNIPTSLYNQDGNNKGANSDGGNVVPLNKAGQS